MVTKEARSWDHIGNPLHFADQPGRERFELPTLGRHSRERLASLGYSAEMISDLETKGVIKQATLRRRVTLQWSDIDRL